MSIPFKCLHSGVPIKELVPRLLLVTVDSALRGDITRKPDVSSSLHQRETVFPIRTRRKVLEQKDGALSTVRHAGGTSWVPPSLDDDPVSNAQAHGGHHDRQQDAFPGALCGNRRFETLEKLGSRSDASVQRS